MSPQCVEGGRLAVLIIFLFFNVSAVVICGYGTYKMYRKIGAKHNSFIHARHPTLSFSSLMMNFIDVLIIQPTHIILIFFIYGYDQMYSSITLLTDIRFILFGFLFSARIWLLHYDYHFGKQCVALLFRKKNEKKKSTKSKLDNFYLKHRHTFGNTRFVIIATFILIIACLFVLDIVPLTHGTYYIRISIYCVEGILLITLYRQVQSIDDKFKIRLEIMLILCIPGLLAFVYMLFELIVTLNPITNIYRINDCAFFYFYCYVMLIIISLTIIIETIIPLQLHKNQSQCVQHTLRMMKSNKTGKQVSFADILGSAQGLLLFVKHLETEFSVENILFLIFVAKYREYYLSKIIPTLLSTHEAILKPSNTGASDDEYSTTRDSDKLKTPQKNVFVFEEKNNSNKKHMEISPAPQTPQTPTTPQTPQNQIDNDSMKISPITPRCSNDKHPPSPETVQSESDPHSVSPKSYRPLENEKQRDNTNVSLNQKQSEEETVANIPVNKFVRTNSNVSDSCLRTPIPGSYKHSPMILEQEEILREEEFCLDDSDEESQHKNDETEYLEYVVDDTDKRRAREHHSSINGDIGTIIKNHLDMKPLSSDQDINSDSEQTVHITESNAMHKRNWTVASVISNKKHKTLSDALKLSINALNVSGNKYSDNESDHSMDSKDDLIRRGHTQNKSCTEVRSTTDTNYSPTPVKTSKMRHLLNGLNGAVADYSSVATVIGISSKAKKHISSSQRNGKERRGYSVDFKECETQKEMKRLSILESIFGHKDKQKQKQKQKQKHKDQDKKHKRNVSMNSTASPRNSLFGSNKEKSMKFSNQINYNIIQNCIDFDLKCNISAIVDPLTQDFIPIPTSFNNVDIKEAAKHIFREFIDDGAQYQINISHDNRSMLKWLFEEKELDSMSHLSFIFLFDSAFYEIYITVCSDSFLRFKSSRKFINFLKEGHLKEIPDAHQREDSQWSFNASFVEFNSSLAEIKVDNGNPKLTALPSGQVV